MHTKSKNSGHQKFIHSTISSNAPTTATTISTRLKIKPDTSAKNITVNHVSSRYTSLPLVCSLLLCLLGSVQLAHAAPPPFTPKKSTDTNSRQQRLLVLSLGGFRHDFIQAYNLHNLGKFLHKSARAPFLNPQFTTQSFPNHWSMATGAYVETHGIVANKFYDPRFKEYFAQQGKDNRDVRWWNMSGLAPIWYTSAQQAIKTSVFNWPGCDAFYLANSEMYTKSSYNEIGSMPFTAKLAEAVRMFAEEDYKFIMIYHNQPDSIAHKYGLNSAEFNVTLRQLDEAFGQLLEELKHAGLANSHNFNFILVSDHGLSEVKRNIVINDYFDESDAQIWSFNRNLIHLRPLINTDALIKKLSKIPDITINMRTNMPERLHYKNNPRIGDIILSGIEGVGFIYVNREPLQLNGKALQKPLSYEQKKKLFVAIADKATHGYDRIYPNMKGVFVAHGPMFKRNFTSDYPLENIDLYPLMCNVMSLECDFERNGSFENIRTFFRTDTRQLIQFKRQYAAESSTTRAFFYLSLFLFEALFLHLFSSLAWQPV
jgi:ectonucleotide pyrophosphatase/phosphodiesterase family protein 5